MFGTNVMPQTVLPLGFQSKISISEDAKCDLPNCQITDNHQPWTILRGCGHSFHECCIDEYYCPICKQFLDEKVKDLGKTIQDGIFHTSAKPDGEESPDSETDEDTIDDLETSSCMVQSVEAINDEIRNLISKTPQKCDHLTNRRHHNQKSHYIVPFVFIQL
jgi:hypothetical protein